MFPQIIYFSCFYGVCMCVCVCVCVSLSLTIFLFIKMGGAVPERAKCLWRDNKGFLIYKENDVSPISLRSRCIECNLTNALVYLQNLPICHIQFNRKLFIMIHFFIYINLYIKSMIQKICINKKK